MTVKTKSYTFNFPGKRDKQPSIPGLCENEERQTLLHGGKI